MWGAGGAVIYQLFALFAQTVLTYLLTRAQYGSYGKAFALLGLAMLVQQVGFNEILMRRQARLELWASVAFWCALTLGLLGSVTLLVLAHPLGLLYADPELTTLILLMSPTPLVRSLLVLPTAQLVAAMRFRLHYGLMLLNALVTSSATLVFAFLGLGAKSFVAGTLLADPLYVVILWRVAGSRVRAGPRPSRWLLLSRDLRFVFGSNMARWIRASIDPLIFGLFAPAGAVGVYFFAQSMAVQIIRVVTLNLSGVLLPALNRLSDDPQRQTAAFLRAARVLTLIGAPLCVGLGAISPLFVRVFLDAHKWAALPPVLGILAVGMAFRLADEPIQSLISAQGRFRLGFQLSLGTGLLYLVASSVGSMRGSPVALAATAACYYAIIGPTLLYLAIRVGGGRFFEALRVFWTPFLLAIAAIAPWTLLDPCIPGHGRTRDCLVLAAVVICSAASYCLLGRSVQPTGWNELLEQMHSRVPGQFKPFVAWVAASGPTPTQRNSSHVASSIRRHQAR